MSSFEEAIEAARRVSPARDLTVDTSTLGEGAEVQLSVRVPEGLRSAVASTAADQGITLTALVMRALRKEVLEVNDSFSGLTAELAHNVRAEVRSAIETGAYREASAEVEREEAWS